MQRARIVLLATIVCAAGGAGAWSPSTAAAAGGPLRWSSPRLVDHATLPGKPTALNSLSCPAAGLCIGVGARGQVESSPDPASTNAWGSAVVDQGADLEGVACPSASLCVAVSATGDVLSSAAPTTSGWSTRAGLFSTPDEPMGGVACASASLCVAVDGGDQIATSTNPGAGVWSVSSPAGAHQFDSVSCPSASLCVIADFDGNVLTSTDPAAGASSYVITSLGVDLNDPNQVFGLLAVSCASVTRCVAGDEDGDLLSSENPAGGAAAWPVAHVDGLNQIDSVSCPAAGLCVAVDDAGNLFTSTSPGGWTTANTVDPSGFGAVTCQSTMLCVAGAADGSVAVSSDPSASPSVWRHTPPVGGGPARHPALRAISCPTASSCTALDGAGKLLTTRNPAGSAPWTTRTLNPGLGGATSLSCLASGFCAAMGPLSHVAVGDVRGAVPWRLADLNLFALDDNGDEAADALGPVSCVSRSLCVATDYSQGVGSAGLLEVSHDPGAGGRSWGEVSLGSPDFDFFNGISCPSRRLCVAADGQADRAAISTDDARHWSFVKVGGSGLDDVSCPTTSFCAAVDQKGNVVTSTRPSAGSKAWHLARIDRHALSAISCASATLCAALDGIRRVLVSTDPSRARSWTATQLGHGLTGVTCPSNRLCLVTTNAGSVYVGRRRFG